ncbi:MAG TPA: amino acid adenylation domain-containing protein [Gaiellaceae bacterium]
MSARRSPDAGTLAQRAARLTTAKRGLLELQLEQEAMPPGRTSSGGPTKAPAGARLTSNQQRLWLLEQLRADAPPFAVHRAFEISGSLDERRLRHALEAVVLHHEAFRSRLVVVDGTPRWAIGAPEPVAIRAAQGDLRRAARWLEEETSRPFDFRTEPPLRCSLLRAADDAGSALLLSAHLIACDEPSFELVLREFEAAYRAAAAGSSKANPEAVPSLSYRLSDEQDASVGADQERSLLYWRERLRDAPVVELPGDRPRSGDRTHAGGRRSTSLSSEVAARAVSFAEANGVPVPIVMFAAYCAFLQRYTRQDDFIVATLLACRSEAAEGRGVGPQADLVATRVDCSGEPTFAELTRRVAATLAGDSAHAHVPYASLIDELHPSRDLSRPPLAQVAMTCKDLPHVPAIDGAEAVRLLEVPPGAVLFDLRLVSSFDGERPVAATFEYSVELFDPATVDRMLRHLVHLMAGAMLDPDRPVSELPLLSPEERRHLLDELNATVRPFAEHRCIHELIEEQVARTPAATAVEFDGRALTYAELDSQANRLAHHLRDGGVIEDAVVGVFLARSLEAVVSLLAVLKAGGAYLPLDPSYPAERIGFMLEAADVPVIVTGGALRGRLPKTSATVVDLGEDAETIARRPGAKPTTAAGPGNLAYVIYTSGSTGKPKGVLIEHRGVCNLASVVVETFGLGPGSRVLQFASLGFDASVTEILIPLSIGAAVCLASQEILSSGADLVRFLRDEAIDTATLPPSLLAVLPDDSLPGLRTLCSAGEACPPEVVRRWADGRRFINGYGPTEATVAATYHTFREADGVSRVPLGRPIANVRCYVLDRHLQPVPIGVAGELHIGGVGVARGYVNRPDLTASRFVPDPFCGTPDRTMYKTGDLVRVRADGTLEFVGRVDRQAKVRGFRIELGEVEAALRGHRAVGDCVVDVREDRPGERRLVAYLVVQGECPAVGELRTFLESTLPAYMVPSAFVVLERLPTTVAGKVDWKALPPVGRERPRLTSRFSRPETPVEVALAGIWREILGVEQIGIDDDFFEIGGDSLRATQVASRLQRLLRVELPLRELFEKTTVRKLGSAISARAIAAESGRPLEEVAERVEGLTSEKRAILERKLLRGSSPDGAEVAIPPRRPGEAVPLSLAQQRLWFLDQLVPDSPLYNAALVLRLQGELDVGALRRSVDAMVARHEALRTTFYEIDGIPMQRVTDRTSVDFVELDVRDRPLPERDAAALVALREEARRPFDLARDPMMRPVLVRLDVQEWILMLVTHHIAADGWSKGIVFDEIRAHYEGLTQGTRVELPDLPVQYADFAAWQRRWFEGGKFERQLAFWEQQLIGAPGFLRLPTDRERPAEQTFTGRHHPVRMDKELADSVREFSRRHRVTPFMGLLAGFAALLSAYSNDEDILIGSPIANRTRMETENLIGFFVNTLVFRVDLSGDPTFLDLTERVKDAALGAYGHQDVPFEKLVEILRPRRDPSRNPLVQVNFRVQASAGPELRLPGLTVTPIEIDLGTSRFDLACELQVEDDGIGGYIEYATDLFTGPTAARIAANFRAVLEEVLVRPDTRLSALSVRSDIDAHRREMRAAV